MNHKRVGRIMREDNLALSAQAKVYSDDRFESPVPGSYPNLARGPWKLTGIDQLCAIADITYIRLETEFVYLAVVLDAYSRRSRSVGRWIVNMEDDLSIAALNLAFRRRRPTGEVDPSFRPGRAVCFQRDYTDSAQRTRCPDQHEPKRKSLRQCGQVRIVS